MKLIFFLSTNKVLIKKTFCERFFKIIFCENTPNTVILLSQLCSGCFALSDQWNLHLLMFLSKKYCFIHNPIIWKQNLGRKQFRTSTGNSWGLYFTSLHTVLPPPALTPRWGFDHWVSYGKNIKMVQNGQYFVFVLLNTVINFTKDSIR